MSEEIKDYLAQMKAERTELLELAKSARETVAAQHRTICRLVIAAFVAIVCIVGGFLYYLSLYSYESTTTYEYAADGVYALIDSTGNIIAQDLTDEQLAEFERWYEIHGEGVSQD